MGQPLALLRKGVTLAAPSSRIPPARAQTHGRSGDGTDALAGLCGPDVGCKRRPLPIVLWFCRGAWSWRACSKAFFDPTAFPAPGCTDAARGCPGRRNEVRHGVERFSIADPNDAGMRDVFGFGLAAPTLIANFVRD